MSWKIPRGRKWQPTPEFLSGELHAQRSLAGYSPWGYKESDTTEWPILSLPWLSKLSPIWPQPASSSTSRLSSPAKACPTMHISSPLNHKGQLRFPNTPMPFHTTWGGFQSTHLLSFLNTIPFSFCLAKLCLYFKGPRWCISLSLKAFSIVFPSDRRRPSIWGSHTWLIPLLPYAHMPFVAFCGPAYMWAELLSCSLLCLHS